MFLLWFRQEQVIRFWEWSGSPSGRGAELSEYFSSLLMMSYPCLCCLFFPMFALPFLCHFLSLGAGPRRRQLLHVTHLMQGISLMFCLNTPAFQSLSARELQFSMLKPAKSTASCLPGPTLLLWHSTQLSLHLPLSPGPHFPSCASPFFPLHPVSFHNNSVPILLILSLRFGPPYTTH